MTSALTSLAPLLSEPCLIEDVLARLSDWIAQESGCQRARLFRVDRSTLELHCLVTQGADTYTIRLPANRGLHGQVILGQKPQTGRSPETGDVLMVVPVFAPVPRPDRDVDVIAILEVANKSNGQPFDANDEDQVSRVARSVAEVLVFVGLDDSRRAPERVTGIVGGSAAMRTLYNGMVSASGQSSPVVLTGEHGTGKTLIARAIHHLGPRRQLPFVEVGYQLHAELLESELFGSSPHDTSGGAVRRAQGGTLLIEQPATLSLSSQARLLDMAEQFRVRLMTTEVPGEPAAPALPAWQEQQVRLSVPSLAERGPDDISSLARYFARVWGRRYGRTHMELEDEALVRLRSHAWVGNVAALEQSIQQAVLVSTNDKVTAANLGLPGGGTNGSSNDSIPSGLLLADAEERYILRTLAENHDNRTRTASSLGIGRNTLVRKIKQYRNK